MAAHSDEVEALLAEGKTDHKPIIRRIRDLDTASLPGAELRSLRPDRWTGVEIREYLVLKYDGNTVRFPVETATLLKRVSELR